MIAYLHITHTPHRVIVSFHRNRHYEKAKKISLVDSIHSLNYFETVIELSSVDSNQIVACVFYSHIFDQNEKGLCLNINVLNCLEFHKLVLKVKWSNVRVCKNYLLNIFFKSSV